MAGVFPEQAIEEVKRRTSLVSLIGEYIRLKKAGRSHVGLCPFHGEKTPSFHVHEGEGFYYCFGCQAKGDAISFLREHVGFTFPEAVRHLAERTGVELPEERRDPDAARRRQERKAARQRFAEINDLAQAFFRQRLSGPALAYLHDKRGLTDATIERFGVGYAPDAWDELSREVARAGFQAVRDAQAVGLIGQRRNEGSGHYDKYRHRVMFPVFGALRGEVVAFAGRTLSHDKETPKYVNSSESEIFTKGRTLFGLYLAKPAIRQRERLIIVEGQVDVLSMAQAGFEETVAPMGTALTEDQVQLARRFASHLVLLYDGDSAGRAAAMKAVPMLLHEGLSGTVVWMPDGEDPDSFVREYGGDEMERLLSQGRPLFDAYMDEILKGYDGTVPSRTAVMTELRPIFQLLGVADQAAYRRVIAQRLGILEGDLQAWGRGANSQSRGAMPRASRPGGRPSGAQAPKPETLLLRIMLDHPQFLPYWEAEGGPKLMTHAGVRAVIEAALRIFQERGRLDVVALLDELNASGMQRASDSVARLMADERPPEISAQAEEAFVQIIETLKGAAAKAERKRRRRAMSHSLSVSEQLALANETLAGK